MCTYLDQVRGTYYFRRVIPAELRPFILTSTGKPRTEWKLSLGTKDRDEAKRLIPARTIESQRLLDAASATLAHGSALPSPPVPNRSPWASEEAFEHWQAGERERAEQGARHRSRRHHRQSIRADRDRPSVEIGPERAAVRDIIREQRSEPDVAAEHATMARLLNAEQAGASPQAAAEGTPEGSTGPMLDAAVIDRWAAERKVDPKGKDAHRAVARWFYERTERKPVAAITRKDVLAFKDAMVNEGQSLANVRVKLSRLRTLLKWATDNELVPENVATGVDVKDTDKARNKRLPFDLAALDRIFSSPVYSQGARPVGGKGEASYWLPLLALFTGARLEELGQLRSGDVQPIRYPDADGTMRESWFIRISEDVTDNMTLKNAGSERDVPVHPELERLGFLQFAQQAAQAGQHRLFPVLKPDKYGRLTAKWGEWFGPYMRNECGISDRRMVFHVSLR